MTAAQDQVNNTPTSTDLVGRDHRGKYIRTIDTAERDAEAARLKARGWTYRQIASHLGVDVAAAHKMVRRVLLETVAEPAEEVRAGEVARYDESLRNLEGLRATVLELLERKHYTVSNGRVVCLDDEPLEDDGFVLQVVDRLNAIESQRITVAARRAKLLGLDVPVKQEIAVDLGVEYRIVGVDVGQLR